MECEPIRLQAQCISTLNHALSKLALGSDLSLIICTPNWHVTGWSVITAGCSAAPQTTINGLTAPLHLYLTTGGQYLWAIQPFWQQAILPQQQWLQISWPDRCQGQLLQLHADDAISPWQLLHLLRPDVSQPTAEDMRPWLFWNGMHECNLLRHHPGVLAELNRPIDGNQIPWFHSVLRDQRPDLQAAIEDNNHAAMLHWLTNHGATEHQLHPISRKGLLRSEQQQLTPWKERPFGVNLFGYASDVLGIGEDLRTVHSALRSAKIPVQVVDIPCEPCSDALRQLAAHQADELAPYAFNLFCLTAEEHARVLLELGNNILRERFSIGYWPWELSRWPQPWQPLLVLADELWSSSQHTHKTLQAAIAERPSPSLQHLPLPVEPLQPLSHEQQRSFRKQLDLPPNAQLLICSFDGRSSYHRKNPWAAIQAFQQALPLESEARLIIKTMHAGLEPDQWRQLQACAEADSRLVLIDAVLERDQLLNLYGCCDVLISLHRAEGYGRVLAEALLLGLDVVATNYSGNTDFCIGPLAHPVQCTLLPVLPHQYPHTEDQVWAEPDQRQASQVLQRVLARRAAEPNRRFQHVAYYADLFSPHLLGQRYAKRLRQIWSPETTCN